MHILHTVLHNSKDADKENLINNQESLWLVIISIILVTLMCDPGGILLGEVRCYSPLGGGGVKGLVFHNCMLDNVWIS